MKVFRLLPNYKDYWCFELDIDHLAAKLQIDPNSDEYDNLLDFGSQGVRYSDTWAQPNATFKRLPDWPNANDIPDITLFNYSSIVLSQRAASLLEQSLSALGELLPVDIRGRSYYLLNVLARFPIDQEKSEWNMIYGAIDSPKRIVFEQEKLNQYMLFYCD
jgi:hypothetical protein